MKRAISAIVFCLVIGGRVYGQEPATAPVAEPSAPVSDMADLKAQVKALQEQLAALNAKVPVPTAQEALDKKTREYVEAVDRAKAVWKPICKALKGKPIIIAGADGKITSTCEVWP